MSEYNPADYSESCQEGVTPVQSFVVQAIPIVPGMVLEPRLGRPVRTLVDANEVPAHDAVSDDSTPKFEQPEPR